jgi:hypothetical protein
MRYTVILEQEPDGGYIATVPALPGCVSQGDTREEALNNIGEARPGSPSSLCSPLLLGAFLPDG